MSQRKVVKNPKTLIWRIVHSDASLSATRAECAEARHGLASREATRTRR
jgi:hypothetical protein